MMADEFARPEETLASRRERDENRRFADSLRSASNALNAEASQAKLLLPKLILRRKAVESQIASKQRELANDRINLQLVQDKISSAKFEQSERTKLQAKLAEELANKQQLLASSQGELAYRQDLNQVLTNELQQKRANLEVQQQTLSLSKIELAQKQATLEARQQELKAAQDNLTAKTAGRDVTQSELDRVMTLYAEQVNADILAGKGASDAQKALAQRKFELTSALEMYQQEIQTAQRSVETLPGTIAGLERSLAVQAIEVEALTENVTGAQSEIVQLVNKIEDNNRELTELPSEIQGLTSEVKQLESEIKKNDDALAKLPVEIQGLTFTAQRLSDNMEQKERDIRNLKLKSLSDTLTQVGQALIELREKIYSLQQELGTTFGTAISVGAGALVNRVTSFFSGGPILSFQETIDTVNAFQKEFGGILTRGEAQRIAQASKLLGVSADIFLKAQRNFLVVGGNVTKNTFIGQFRAAGLTAANALQFAAQNANLVAIAGAKYANELARAAANAQRIGVGLDKTEALADGIVGDFEGALERFSELRAMGVEVDFNKLAAVAGTGTPQEVLSELQGQLGGNQKLLEELQRNRFLKVALERDLGINVADITKLAAGEEAKAPEQTQEEKDRTARDMLLERVGTVTSGIGKLIGAFVGVNAFLGANTMATNANTLALGTQTSGMISKLTGMVGKLSGLGSGLSGLARFGIGGAGVGIGIGGSLYGRELVKQGKTGTGIGLGTLAGLVGGGLLAVATGGAAIPFLLGGAALGGGISASGMIGRAKGGLVSGPGTSTSDSIPTKLSNGEFVINANTTKKLGTTTLSALNSGASISSVRLPTTDNTIPLSNFGSRLDLTRQMQTMLGAVGNNPASVLNNNYAVTAGTKVASPGTLTPAQITKQQQPEINNVVNVNMDKMEAKLDRLAAAFSNIKIEMDGNTVGRVTANSRSSMDRLAVIG